MVGIRGRSTERDSAVEQPKTLYSGRTDLVDQELGTIDRGKSPA